MNRVDACQNAGVMRGAFGTASCVGIQAAPAEQDSKKERPVYVSLRVTAEEKTRLAHDAAGMSISAYVRGRLFGEAARPRKTRGKFPVKDYEALARVLRALGRSDLHNTLHCLMLAVEEGRVPLDRGLEMELRQSLAAVESMRDDLVAALGLKARPS